MYITILLDSRNHTVAGTLNTNTVFQANGHFTTHADFKEGDVVLVQWKAAKNDKIIEFIAKGAVVADFIEGQ